MLRSALEELVIQRKSINDGTKMTISAQGILGARRQSLPSSTGSMTSGDRLPEIECQYPGQKNVDAHGKRGQHGPSFQKA